MQIRAINNFVNFKRRPTTNEEPALKSACNRAFNAIGSTDRVVITHGSCFPSTDRDCFVGSPYGKSAREYIKFLALYGFNANQLGPAGELEMVSGKIKPSPYNSSAFAKNLLFIDLQELTSNKYGNILSQETLVKLSQAPEFTDNNYDLSDFDEAKFVYDKALDESYKNFKSNLAKGQPQALLLNREFVSFLDKHDKRLTDEGIFKVLSKTYGTDDFDTWGNELDENLILSLKDNDKKALERYRNLKIQNKYDIDKYKFEQFIATKQIKENQQWRKSSGFRYISDFLVGCSKMDYWRCKDAFLQGYQLGAPEHGRNPQAWDIPVLNPRKLFIDADMNLGVAGQFLKDKLDFALEFCENVRIDHAMGLIEPFIIEDDSILYDEEGNVVNTSENPVNGHYMSEMHASDGEKLDNYKNFSCDHWHNNGNVTYYSNVMNKIVIPTLREHGISEKSAVWEDICSQPNVFTQVFYRNLNLPGLTQLEWSRVEFSPKENWYLVGSHDSIPAQNMIKRDWTKNSEAWNHLYLAGYLHQDNIRSDERNEFCKKIELNDKERVKAKFAELMTTKKFQISFADLLGITDITYNIGGSNREENWKTRISSDFLDKYYEDLASESPVAINVPEVLKIALKAKIDMKIAESLDKDKTRQELYEKYQPLLNELEHFEKVLKI